jgi:hypothetical protein
MTVWVITERYEGDEAEVYGVFESRANAMIQLQMLAGQIREPLSPDVSPNSNYTHYFDDGVGYYSINQHPIK